MVTSRRPLLANLAGMFVSQTENVAVEALGHILSGSEAARDALSDVLQAGGAEVGKIARIRTQDIGEDGARPDLACVGQDGNVRVLIEAKFWAGLTENQPGGYLARLEAGPRPSALLFVAPASRLEVLWAELCRQLPSGGPAVLSNLHSGADELWSATTGAGPHLMLISWRSLLGRMEAKASAAADSHTEADIRQLQGLAEQQDEEAFLPLRQEELGPQIPRRVIDVISLIDDAIAIARENEWASTEGYKTSSYRQGYGTGLKLGTAKAWFGVDYRDWARCRDTPLWLYLYLTADSDMLRALDPLRSENPPALIETGSDVKIPIHVPVGKERNAVLEAVVESLRKIAQLTHEVRSADSNTE